ncbi:hypothetical protein JSO54_02960 [Riemerella anatipestifer]|uniref:hypothetical protein n=1 Tax=Riemerella anatipestifer TaxID=34085 RepID=UPI0030BA64D5
MYKFLVFCFTFIFLGGFAQEKKSDKLGIFTGVNANVGLDLASILRRNNTNTNNHTLNNSRSDEKFAYGFASELGIQPFNWFAISGGIKYNYVSDNYHLLYYIINPYIFVTKAEDHDFGYIGLKLGKQFNRSAANDTAYWGLSVGKFDASLYRNLGQKFEISLEGYSMGNWFIGFSYGIVFYSNKSL